MRTKRERGGIVEWLGRKKRCEKREFIFIFLSSFSYRRSITGFCFKWQRIFFPGFIVKLDFLFIYLFK